MKFKNIALASIELEGNWFNPRNDLVPDGSIRKEHFKNPQYVGELVSQPFDNYIKLIDFIRNNYPDEVNHKSGLHCHVSFKHVGLYSQLMRKEFYDYFLNKITEWAKIYKCTNPLFWKRLNGEMPEYCAKKFQPEKQLEAKNKDEARPHRATHLNYCWGQHHTIENRLACSFLCADTAISYITAYLECVESYLEKSDAEEHPIKIELSESEDIENEDTIRIKPFKIKLKPFNFFSNDYIYKGDTFNKKKKTKDINNDSSIVSATEIWDELLVPKVVNQFIDEYGEKEIF